jgi:hypothetical protein
MGLKAFGRAWERKLRSLPAHLAHRISSVAPIERALDARYNRLRHAHQRAVPMLAGLDQQISRGLERDGIFATSLAALAIPEAEHVLETARGLAIGYAATARSRAARGDKFIMIPPMATLLQPLLFAWGVQERLLNIVEAYLGLPPAYDGMAIVYTVADGKEEAAREWHRDREDLRMVKIAIYLNDVDIDGGPFELDTRCEQAIDKPDAASVRTCLGKAGTVIFADTARCLHRGRPPDQDRAAIFYSYFSQRPRRPFFCERSGLTRAQVVALTAGFTPRQTVSSLWHDHLPPLIRIIPSAPI